MKILFVTSALSIAVFTSFLAEATESTKPRKTAPNLSDTTKWLSEFAPSRLAYSSLDIGPFNTPEPGAHQINLVENIAFIGCETSIKKFEDRVHVRFEIEKGGLTQYSRKRWVSFSFNLSGTQTTLDPDDDREAKPRGYHLLRIRFKPGCEAVGNCSRFAIKQYEEEGENPRLISSKVVDGGIYFEASKKNTDELSRIAKAFNHAASLCSKSNQPSPF